MNIKDIISFIRSKSNKKSNRRACEICMNCSDCETCSLTGVCSLEAKRKLSQYQDDGIIIED